MAKNLLSIPLEFLKYFKISSTSTGILFKKMCKEIMYFPRLAEAGKIMENEIICKHVALIENFLQKYFSLQVVLTK